MSVCVCVHIYREVDCIHTFVLFFPTWIYEKDEFSVPTANTETPYKYSDVLCTYYCYDISKYGTPPLCDAHNTRRNS